jgi:hypothetical protein
MAVTKTVIKKVRQQAIVKFVGDIAGGTANVDLIADLKLTDETMISDAANIKVNINSIYYNNGSSTNPITINRNNGAGANLYLLFGNDNWMFTQASGFSDTSNNTANVVVTIPAPGGTVILGLTKERGFSEPQQQQNQS